MHNERCTSGSVGGHGKPTTATSHGAHGLPNQVLRYLGGSRRCASTIFLGAVFAENVFGCLGVRRFGQQRRQGRADFALGA